ncbi:tetratricopeptide repeat-containing sensor histidine kinase [Ulvibacterium marinum]|uniref:histidine kinase n=1 Tax=Ulvibacterium marinum TaxID=2419782 RepID=A0A3B0C915_9FLAO|nr:tetratricopeptide repeat-containing sensor histidine kinase [Ulvibacterium marinum]RKN80874.1 histidine kinase [Ulvibacterium marinum]
MSRINAYFKSFPKYWRNYILLCVFGVLSIHFPFAQSTKRSDLEDQINTIRSQSNFNPQDTTYINLLNSLGAELRFYNLDSLLILSKEALVHSESAEYQKGESMSLLGIAEYYSDRGDHTEGISHYTKALVLAKELNNPNLILRLQNNLAGEFGYLGDYAKALSGYLESIEIAKRVDDQLMLSILNENIANLYATQKDYKQALDFYEIVKKINQGIGNEVTSAETMSNMASVYADMGKLDYAMFNINSSITVFEKHDIRDWLAFAFEVKGKTYLKQEKYKWALYWYNQAEMLHKKLDDDRGEIDLLNGMAEAHLGLKNDSISQHYALRAYKISTKINFKEGTQKCAGTLYKINKNKQDFATALKYHEVYQSLSDTLSRNENKKGLTMLKTKVEHEKQKMALVRENEMALATQRNYVNAALAILLVFVVVTFLVHRGEKIQKKLNKRLQIKAEELEQNDLELREINETKDKLFSIIAHDLRGPIGAFQGLLKLFKEKEIDQTEFLNFIPKLRTDIDHIAFTLNNLLSWGKSQMNGATTKPRIIPLENIVEENINLLSEIATNKSIKITSQLTPNTMAWSDANQIDIVIRNLISNALKFTPKDGMITLKAIEKNKHWEISVRDTGVGMDRETQEKIFDDNSNITTYGTDNEKGTGLGLSLCKEMVEKNGGTIWVESYLRKGSTFFFTVPKASKEYQKAV